MFIFMIKHLQSRLWLTLAAIYTVFNKPVICFFRGVRLLTQLVVTNENQ